MQVRTHGLLTDLPAMHALVARTQTCAATSPGTETAWADAVARVGLP